MRHDDTEATTDTAVLQQATAAASAILTDGPRRRAALTYLRQRGVDATMLPTSWPLGYAPPGWTRLVDKLAGQFSDQVLLDAGLAQRSSRGSLIDTFRDRVIFPIHDCDGRVAGFIGRDLSGDEHAPKYLNTRQHAGFDKGRRLYGLRESQTINPDASRPVVVEGPLDVLAIATRTTVSNDGDLLPVAACGTAFTTAHARQIATIAFEYRSPAVVAFDSDTAGRTAARAAGERLRALGVDTRIAVLPSGTDPAEYLARPSGTLEPFRDSHVLPLLTVQVQHAIADQGDRMQWIEGRLAAARTIAACLATYPASYTAGQIGWISKAIQLDPSTVTLEIATAYRVNGRQPERVDQITRQAQPIGL